MFEFIVGIIISKESAGGGRKEKTSLLSVSGRVVDKGKSFVFPLQTNTTKIRHVFDDDIFSDILFCRRVAYEEFEMPKMRNLKNIKPK